MADQGAAMEVSPREEDPSNDTKPQGIQEQAATKRPRAEDDATDAADAQPAPLSDSPDTKRTKTDNTTSTTENGDVSEATMKIETPEVTESKDESPQVTAAANDEASGEGQNRQRANGWLTSPAVTRRRATATTKESNNGESNDGVTDHATSTPLEVPYRSRIGGERWIVHQMTEDYVGFVGTMMYPGRQNRPYGFDRQNSQYPLDGVSPLGYLKSPLRRPTVAEHWSPYEVAVFEAALTHHGKEFHKVSREIETKTTREVIDFYYTWKKTAHYKKWKEIYISDDILEYESPANIKMRRK